MSTLLTRLEVTKLADELGTAEEDLHFLAEGAVADLRELRHLITHARYARHERRLSRLAGLSKLAPAAMTARISEHALGAEVSARVATLIDPADAGKLTRHLAPSLPETLIVDVGHRLLARGEHLTLTRFVAVVSVDVALQVLEDATADELLTLGMFAEDHAALDAIVARFSDERISSVVEVADSSGRHEDAIAMLSFLGPETQKRFLAVINGLPDAERDRFTRLATELGYLDLLA